ncbi:serum paraoxonase/arylesterase 2 [Aplysia californica]|uniref:Paraoxonase n=1 Tax=Aplysia californica TaxID=6500 RepID=A0ABM1VXP5_APLCA|nr:serum paraoxonase/arylesterase 2 [Aplysia californica]
MLFKALAVALVAVVLSYCLRVLYSLGFHLHNFQHKPGVCRKVEGIPPGSEDMRMLSDGSVFITSGYMTNLASPSFKEFYFKHRENGGIFFVNLTAPNVEAKEVQILESASFQLANFFPHGLDVVENKESGRHVIFVVNHVIGSRDRIEKFRYLPKTSQLEHLASFSGKELGLCNDVAALSKDAFYVTNSMYSNGLPWSILEGLSFIKKGSIVFNDGSGFSEVVSNIRLPNGITISKDESFVYVAMDNDLYVYQRAKDNKLTLIQEVPLNTLVDNCFIPESGDVLYVGAHPVLYKLLGHLDEPSQGAPSQVLALPLRQGKVLEEGIRELLYDEGALISGSSVAVPHQGRILVGSVMSSLVLCDVNVPLD